MDIDIAAYTGDNRKPVVILIHGLGMDKTIWKIHPGPLLRWKSAGQHFTDQASLPKGLQMFEKKTSSLSSGFKTGVRPRSLRTIFHDLRAKDYPVIAWSQKRPVGDLAEAVKELSEVIPLAKRLSENGIILVGHSRGGSSQENILCTIAAI